jgi:hypothetical protein
MQEQCSILTNLNIQARHWTAEEIARAQLTEPISPSAYVSPAGPYIVELYARHVHHIESEINSNLPAFSKDRD